MNPHPPRASPQGHERDAFSPEELLGGKTEGLDGTVTRECCKQSETPES